MPNGRKMVDGEFSGSLLCNDKGMDYLLMIATVVCFQLSMADRYISSYFTSHLEDFTALYIRK